MSTEQFVVALSEYDLNPTEIADILWLALRQPREHIETDPDVTQEDDREDIVQEEGEIPPDNLPDFESLVDEIDDRSDEEPEADSEPTADIVPDIPSGTLRSKALPISVPDSGYLEETLPLVRALKPLLKQINSQTGSHINEIETVERIAETDIWSPVLHPDQEPWLEVALVIDDNAGMNLWQRLIQDIQRLLRCYGSFRDFRVWKLSVTDGGVGICAVPDQTPRNPRALLAPDNRRLVLVFSDCTADYWWDGRMSPILALWGQTMPTTIWQVLPDWMWKRTALGVGEYVAIRNRMPGAINSRLRPIYLSLRASRRGSSAVDDAVASASGINIPVCVPVITSDDKSIRAWSLMLAGDRRQSTPGFVLPSTGWETIRRPDVTTGDEEAADKYADDQLEQFRLRATPEARRLAALLSAAPVITLPVMRLIRAADWARLPGTSPLPVAEVFLGGLLQRSLNQDIQDDPELIQYTFPDRTRDRLLDVLPEVETIDVIEAVSKHIAERLNCTLADFRALLLSPDLRKEADQYGLRSFAQVTAQILRTLGPDYADLADQLESPQALVEQDESVEEEPTEQADWPDFPLELFEFEVAEYLNIPPLEPFDFIDAQFEDTDFPPFETDEFTIITVEVQRTEDPPSGLESFDYTVATLVRSGSDFRIERQRQTAYRFIEELSDLSGASFFDGIAKRLGFQRNRENCNLEMVAISGGIFIMGSPDYEPERYESESPQHEVTIAPFYMSRYPITQAQWKCVVTMSQVNKNLISDLSYFKRDDLPVERVSWNDAVEFCDRLSAHTNRHYRLPTEAEWEYACRAGTTTPFHFGETIIKDVASYDGFYNKGTTPVKQYGVANAFGLSDMHGNVWEWCQDHWHANYHGAPEDGSAWIEGSDSSNRILRGGSWNSIPRNCRSTSRYDSYPNYRNFSYGFRVVCSPPTTL